MWPWISCLVGNTCCFVTWWKLCHRLVGCGSALPGEGEEASLVMCNKRQECNWVIVGWRFSEYCMCACLPVRVCVNVCAHVHVCGHPATLRTTSWTGKKYCVSRTGQYWNVSDESCHTDLPSHGCVALGCCFIRKSARVFPSPPWLPEQLLNLTELSLTPSRAWESAHIWEPAHNIWKPFLFARFEHSKPFSPGLITNHFLSSIFHRHVSCDWSPRFISGPQACARA